MIDWREVVQKYNRKYGTDYLVKESLLYALYVHKNISLRGIEDRMLVSFGTVRNSLLRMGVELRPQAREKGITAKFLEIPAQEMAKMTTIEIAARLDTNSKYAWQLCKRYGRRWRKYGKPEGFKKRR